VILPALYRGLTAAAAPLVVVYLKSRRRKGKEDDQRFPERLGIPGRERPDGPLVWVHAASIGEATSVLALIERMIDERPRLEILITTGTVAAARLLEPRLPPRTRHQFVPADLPGAVARFLDHWRPDLALWVESELWPNLVLMTRQRDIPMLLLNARLSARSHARWRIWGALARPMLASFSLCLAQDNAQIDRFRELGARQVASVGDLKSAAKTLPTDAGALDALRREVGDRSRWLAASTHPGEDDIAMAVHRRVARDRPGLLTIIAPRHPIRGDEIAALADARGLRMARRSCDEPILAETDIYLADTFGELGVFYSLAGTAFVGGSLIDRGGHNPFEAARLDCAVLLGPHTANCSAMAEALITADAAETVTDADALADAVARLLSDPHLRAKRAKRAARVAADGLGTLDAVLQRIAPWLDPVAPQAALPAAPLGAPIANADARP
jgi:3-deoxy-D-manno-octulosonic-acid transferase